MQFLAVHFVRLLPAFLIESCARDMLPIHLPLHSRSQGTKGDVLDDELSSFVKQAKDVGRLARALSDGLTSFLLSRMLFSFRCLAAVAAPASALHVGSVRTLGCFELHPDKLMKSKCQGMRLGVSQT